MLGSMKVAILVLLSIECYLNEFLFAIILVFHKFHRNFISFHRNFIYSADDKSHPLHVEAVHAN